MTTAPLVDIALTPEYVAIALSAPAIDRCRHFMQGQEISDEAFRIRRSTQPQCINLKPE
ncbi:hypothetical protein NMB96_02925 [Xanthomonas hortorum]|uniref:hypothetical protein n=1 Tax=Xanthomonas hortorum TaxID=56454 RepID=UPI0003D3408B|nr:hypothetical protein [Xanthomonas hortorum]ETC89923.1 hypothetical protein XHC_0492 [Xanthomonas hortorum pv. carotae str. M081]UTS75648.1 hypothetical protein NMB96_02925 [Xanthomonas hortorum]